MVHSAPIIFRSACTGGAQPLFARARAPVCPSLATPLLVGRNLLEFVKHALHSEPFESSSSGLTVARYSTTLLLEADAGSRDRRCWTLAEQSYKRHSLVSYTRMQCMLECRCLTPPHVTRKVVQNTRPSFSHVRGGSGHETNSGCLAPVGVLIHSSCTLAPRMALC